MNKIAQSLPTNNETQPLSTLKKFKGAEGRILQMGGIAVKVKDESTQKEYYLKVTDLVNGLIGKDCNLSKKARARVRQRILEITGPDSRKPLSSTKLENLFRRFYEEKNKARESYRSGEVVLKKLDELRDELSNIPLLMYTHDLGEIGDHLQPGDIIVKKYHEDNPNPTCTFQKAFARPGLRGAYNFSHTALYLGKRQGVHWVAESTTKETSEPEIRRVRLDDPRFALVPKNQYLIIRNANKQQAEESARIAFKYALKLLPMDERQPLKGDDTVAIKYSYLQAARSLWHSKNLGHFGMQRLLKHYADYDNKIPFQFLGKKRNFFCSHFVQMMQSLGEMNKSDSFQAFIAKHPPPKPHFAEKKGFAKKLAKCWYGIKKTIWAKRLAIMHRKTLHNSLSMHLDAVRTTPQDAVNYMLDHKDNFKVVGITKREQEAAT